MTETEKEVLTKEMKTLERLLIKTRERLIERGEDASCTNRQVFHYYSQLHALASFCSLLGIDNKEYSWIYNI